MRTERIPQVQRISDLLPRILERMPANPKAIREQCPGCSSYSFIRGAGEQMCNRCGCAATR